MASEPLPRLAVRRRLGRHLGEDLTRAGLHTSLFAALTLGANLVSGIATARGLGPAGRGESIAVGVLAQTVGLVFTVGCAHALAFRFARDPAAGPRLLTSWLVFLVPLSGLAFAFGQLVIPAAFGAQDQATIALGRIYLLTVVLVLWSELTHGMLLGGHRYAAANAVRFAQPALFSAAQIACWRLGVLTVESTLLAAAASTLLTQSVAMVLVLRATGGLGRFDPTLARETLWYGFRGQGALLASLNQRLDLVILPALVGAAGIGLYSIAANVSLIVFAVANSFSAIVLPAAVRRGTAGPATVVRSLQVVVVAAFAGAAALFMVARPALEIVYGGSFGDAAEALRLLLPGTALFAAASVLGAGLYAADRPSLATAPHLIGLVVTVGGLLLFVPGGGIAAAAAVSTTAYAAVFVCSLVAYRRVVGLPWRAFVGRFPERRPD